VDSVEIVRAMYQAFAERDEPALLSNIHPSMRVYGRPQHPEASVYEGRDGFRRFAHSDWEAFDEVIYEPQDFVVRGEYVLVPITQSGRGKGSALGIEESIVNVWRVRDGSCVELRNYSTMDEALAAVEREP
jgi:ketosteroid isomerase-like protein